MLADRLIKNQSLYKELCEKYRISYFEEEYNPVTKSFEMMDFSKYDIIIKPGYTGRGVQYYQILKSPKELEYSDLAIICDKGRCLYGFSVFANYIIIHTLEQAMTNT